MPRRSVLIDSGFVLAFAFAFAFGWVGPPPAPAQGPADKAMEAIRREVEAAEKAKRAMNARLKALPNAVVPAAGPQGIFLQGPITVMHGLDEPPKINGMVAPLPKVRLLAGEPDPDDPDGEATPRTTVLFSGKSFDLWVFGRGVNVKYRYSRLDRKLETKIVQADGRGRMTDAQKATLRLAGRGDIKRFLDRVDEQRGVLGDDDNVTVTMTPEQYEKLRAEILSLRSDFAEGPFGLGSLFAKALRKIRDDGSSEGRPAR